MINIAQKNKFVNSAISSSQADSNLNKLNIFGRISKNVVNIGVITVLILAFGLMLYSSKKESAIMDELAHIPSGYSYMKLADYRLNPEHPPLLKDLSAIPLLFMKLNFPKDSPDFQTLINGQWTVGSKFLYESGNDADKIIFWARFLPILLTLGLGLFIFKWAKEILGSGWGFLVFILFMLNPTVLAHGHYVTTDIAAAAGFVWGIYYFIKFLKTPSRKNVIFSGIAFGIAQLLKFSAVLLVPYLAIIFAVFLIKKYWIGFKRENLSSENPEKNNWSNFSIANHIAGFIFIFIIGFIIIYIPYLHHTLNYPIEKQAHDTAFILSSFAGGPDPEMKTCAQWVGLKRQIRCLAEIDIWMTGNKILRPYAQYLLGVLMVMQRSSGGNTTYFLGEVSAGGWWYYFPIVFVLKEPIPSLILIAFAVIFCLLKSAKSLWQKIKQKNIKEFIACKNNPENAKKFELGALLFFVIFYWAYSMKSPLNIGIRHILPTIPFIYILTVYQLKNWFAPITTPIGGMLKKLFVLIKQSASLILKISIIAVVVFWYLLETLSTAPHFISYFNEFGGGSYDGYKYVTDSNFDWGQDLKFLKQWLNDYNNCAETKCGAALKAGCPSKCYTISAPPPRPGETIDKIGIYYFGGGSPVYYLKDKVQWWYPELGQPKGWFALSATFLQGAKGKPAPGFIRKPEESYPWLTESDKPIYRAGTSIFIYKFPE